MAKNTGKVREFCQSGKVGTLNLYPSVMILHFGRQILTLDNRCFENEQENYGPFNIHFTLLKLGRQSLYLNLHVV